MYVTTMKTIYDNMLPRTQAMEKIIKFLETYDFKKLVEERITPSMGIIFLPVSSTMTPSRWRSARRKSMNAMWI